METNNNEQFELFGKKDWKGNSKTMFTTIGSSNHSEQEREKYDFYATDPMALEKLLKLESFQNVWECACGQGHLSEVLKKNFIHGKSSDYVNRGYGEIQDFLSIDVTQWNGDIVTTTKKGSAACYCWIIWEKVYNQETILKWFN
ncbi:hypothetical protein LIT13_06610 [Flavobacterium psychrophilum]|uniref:DNA methyltransferase n=1 Tax=Flavobacterium phage Fpv7 TaxID=1814287 RepID=UPI000814BBE7|nr:hypothetical protein [Flavobacterium psychrophilum]YP_009321245.1 DNA methyltransferase [Flavobacterium phage Fpv7]YP_009322311.1 DNA methyltransferase [Flavobacterium phage Fpv8]YP_009322417.1 DNA methyltransferase [Flavobacterium phage Fpv5]YP_009323711.1 DNA methyltransferase [Flavobacterium phage Fpv10]YP_009324563.1 DNA methyltransferase [Flavobacterium phage Fpv6]YP_009325251.1 DNA methyltransferase [Flavobacterium phage Fpv11]QCW19970.1 conjugal transfer protein [Flavobacterium pha